MGTYKGIHKSKLKDRKTLLEAKTAESSTMQQKAPSQIEGMDVSAGKSRNSFFSLMQALPLSFLSVSFGLSSAEQM